MSLLLRRLQSFSEPLQRRLGGDVVHGLSGAIAIQVGAGVVGFAMLSFAAHAMSAAEFGHLATWLSISQMGSVIALFGQEMFILRALNEYMTSEQPELARGALGFSVQIVVALPLLLAAGVFLVGHLAMRESAGLMLAASLHLVANSLIGFGGHVARYAVGILLAEGTREILWKSLVAAALLLIIRGGSTIDATEFFLIACAALAVALLLQGIATFQALPNAIRDARPVRRVRSWTTASARLWITSTLETLNQYFDVLVIYLLLDAPAAGVYFVATRIANAFGTLLAAAHVFATRRMPRLYFAGRIDEVNRVFAGMAEIILLCVAAGIVTIVLGAETVLEFFGPAFAGQHWVLIVLVAGTALAAAGGPAPAVLLIAGHESKYPFILLGNIVLRLLGFAVLIPMLGLMGAAASATASLLVMAVALNILCRRWTGIDPSVLAIVRATKAPQGARAGLSHMGKADENAANPVCSLPPCGGELERGVSRKLGACGSPLTLPHKGGGNDQHAIAVRARGVQP